MTDVTPDTTATGFDALKGLGSEAVEAEVVREPQIDA
ncbi:MAG: 30S ribosomal protein S9, partial [Gammaproteobacteria bacterium]|nr:30S ribosomal protein S9 [Gammaproteobacteria bacterium]